MHDNELRDPSGVSGRQSDENTPKPCGSEARILRQHGQGIINKQYDRDPFLWSCFTVSQCGVFDVARPDKHIHRPA